MIKPRRKGKMLHIYVCEDNEIQRKKIVKIIENIILMENYDLVLDYYGDNPYTLLKQVNTHENVGLYFLDIDLNCDMDGLTVAKELRKKDPRGYIVFITTHSELSYMPFTYRLEAMDFILKDDFESISNKLYQCVGYAYSQYTSVDNVSHKNFTIRIGERERCIPFRDIIYIETSPNAHNVVLHTINTQIEFPGKITEIMTRLDKRFYRCHRSYCLNRNHIREVNVKKRTIIMSNGDVCLVAAKLIKGLL